MTPGELSRCLGCAMPDADGRHHCAGGKELPPYGGHCICREPGCGPGGKSTPATPATPRPARRRRTTR
ncbi:hypothetical protein AB0C02_30355 [Micromonospora sp. NPDC048999]|uniref:hypothetical protein n=1 Tax=Micromonospora sp. NPDC048999 TaxID=3155391 RepID=UPI00340DC180